MSKRLAIVQSSYIPWKGYFDLINSVDEFILYDDAQYTVRDWRNRNRIKTRHGLMWLTVPVESGSRSRAIKDVRLCEPRWAEKHWRTLVHSYAGAACYGAVRPLLEPLFLECHETHLSGMNHRFCAAICAFLGITTRLRWSSEFALEGDKTARLIRMCRETGATVYVSGPSAQQYIDAEQFDRDGIAIEYFRYEDYPEYRQLFPPFEHRVSIVDLLFNEGANARRFMKTF